MAVNNTLDLIPGGEFRDLDDVERGMEPDDARLRYPLFGRCVNVDEERATPRNGEPLERGVDG
jgi:hypothetical protein